jgi:HAD superfamily phosphoserine phosphatase-like hydrolase
MEKNMKHNVYDFDKTIYKNDSTVDFYRFCLKKHPAVLLELPILMVAAVLYLFRTESKTSFKETFYRFLRHLRSVEKLVSEFWEINQGNIADFYRKRHRDDDIVISASPEFLLQPICEKLGVKNLIASRVDDKTGRYQGENCWGEEKLFRLRKEMPDVEVYEFYSDSLSDAPLAGIAERAYLVKKNRLILWKDYKPSAAEKIKKNYLSGEFFLFVFCGGMGTLTNFIFSMAISTKLNATLSYVFGYAISLFVAYALNARLIFKAKCRMSGFLKFVLSYVPNFVILFTFVAIFLNLFHWNKILVYALAGILGLPITYVLVKILAFGKRWG